MKIGKLSTLVVVSAFMFFGVLYAGQNTANAQNLDSNNNDQAQSADSEDSQSTETNTEEQKADYTYTAQPGDSFTVLARKAIQTYGINKSVDLTPAQIIYAETNIARSTNSPELAVGQQIDFDEEMLNNWVEKAQDLSETEESAWSYYVPFVDFNTDKNGE